MILSQVAWGFVAGAVSASTLSVTAERFGSKLAGSLGGFPSTIAATLFLVALGAEQGRAIDMARQLPMMMSFFGVFLTVYCFFVFRGVIRASALSIGAWLSLSIILLQFPAPALWQSMLACGVSLVLSYLVVQKYLAIPAQQGMKSDLTAGQLIVRTLCGGTIVSVAVLLASISGPRVAALMTAFPAVTLSTLIVTYQTGGAALSAAVAKSMMVSGMVNAAVYSAAVTFCYPALGPTLGTVAAAGVLLASGFLTYRLVHLLD